MERALVIHPHLDLWSGGEYICLKICQALQKTGYQVHLAAEKFDLEEAGEIWGMADILDNCVLATLPELPFKRMKSAQRLGHTSEVRALMNDLKPDVVFNTQMSTYANGGVSILYHPGDLLYLYGNGKLNARELYYSMIRRLRQRS